MKAGDTWTGQLAMGNQAIGRITGRSIFTLKAIEGTSEAPLARIAIALTLHQDVVPQPSGPAGMVMTLGGGAKGVGELLFEREQGADPKEHDEDRLAVQHRHDRPRRRVPRPWTTRRRSR